MHNSAFVFVVSDSRSGSSDSSSQFTSMDAAPGYSQRHPNRVSSFQRVAGLSANSPSGNTT